MSSLLHSYSYNSVLGVVHRGYFSYVWEKSITWIFTCCIRGHISDVNRVVLFLGGNGSDHKMVMPVLITGTVPIAVASWWAWWLLKSPALPMISQPFIRAQIKENIKAPLHWPLCGEFKWPITWKIFPFDDIIMITWADDELSSTRRPCVIQLTVL